MANENGRQVLERLKPVQRLLDDLRAAVEFQEGADAAKVQGDQTIKALEKEIAALQKDRDAVAGRAADEATAHEQRVRDNQAAYERDRDRLNTELATLANRVTIETARWEAKAAELEADYKAKETAARATVEGLEAEAERLRTVIEGFKRDAAPLLR